MRTSAAGIDLIKTFEGLRLNAYQCDARKWTIGYGSTLGVKPGDTITAEQASERLLFDLRRAEGAIERYVRITLKQTQFDALASFIFNVGTAAFAASTLLDKLNQRDFAGVAEEFGRWVHVGSTVSPGLARRRAAEKAMFQAVTK